MNCYEALEIDEVTPVQYVGVYVMKWQPEWGQPTVAFRESDVANKMLWALEARQAYEMRTHNPFGHDCEWCSNCVQRINDMERVAIADARGEA